MFNKLKHWRRFGDLKRESKAIKKMAEKIDTMKETMNKTSPKMFSIFFILSTIPSFYFVDQLLSSKYHEESFRQSATASIKYINLKNILFISCGLVLDRLNFTSPTSKFTFDKMSLKRWKYGALFINTLALMIPPSDNKWVVLPTLVADMVTMFYELQLTNFGIIPFWLYSYRHYIRFLDWVILAVNFWALKRYRNRIESHPHEFISS